MTAAVREYRQAMARFAEMRNIDVWYTRLDVAAIREQLGAAVSGKQMKRFQANVANVRTKDSMRRSPSCVAPSTASCGSSAIRRS